MALTEQQLQARRAGIGGSDAGAVLGLNRWKTPLDVYLEKIGEADPQADNDATYWGNVLEDVVAAEYARREGVRVRRRNMTMASPEHPFMLANVDRTVDGQRKVLECKTAGQYMSDEWGPDGSDQVPDSYLVQVTHYMMVTGYQQADLAVLIGGRDFRIYRIGYDRELADMIAEHEAQFWHEHVEARVPPAPINLDDLQTLYAIDNGESVVATLEQEQEAAELKQLKAQIKDLEKQADDLAAGLKLALGENSILLGADGKPLVTWKKAKDSQRFDAKALQAAHPDIYAQFLTDVQGSRRFLVK